jgi:hypothetical protein
MLNLRGSGGFETSFRQNDSHLEVILCFSCNVLVVDGRSRKVYDFSVDRPLFVKLAKQAFPNDKLVQNLDVVDATARDLAEHGFQ